jgi:hypothetical protein
MAGPQKKDSLVAHLGVVASAGANQATAAIIPYSSAVGLTHGNPMMVEITGTLFANIPLGGQVGDEILIYSKAGATPSINCAVGDSFLGTAPVVMSANSMISVQCIERTAAGVCTWMRES